MDENYEIKTVIISYDDDTEPIEVDVVIGDGKTVFDENFEFDYRIYFYFHDQAEYDLAKGEEIQHDAGIEFRIVEEVE
jgi:hypothetical protein